MAKDKVKSQDAGKDKVKSQDAGAEAIIDEAPVAVINGNEYPMRRLGVRDTFRLARIVAAGAAGLGQQLGTVGDSPEQIMMLLIAGIPFAEKQAIELLADIIGVKPDDFADPEKFPMGSEIEIAEKLAEHQDLRAFFDKFGKLLKSPALKGLAANSTAS